MSRANTLAAQFLNKSAKEEPAKKTKQSQELVQSGPINSFRNLFDYRKLGLDESREIEELLWDHSDERIVADQLREDAEQLQHLTAEIRAISKQGIILLGERIHRAQGILKRYGDGQGAFTTWLVRTFGNRRSAYNMLSYYEFHEAMPTAELKEKLKSMPVQAVYSLASRQAPFDQKLAIVQQYNGERQKDILLLIQQKLPVSDGDARKSKVDPVPMDTLEKLCHTFETLGADQLGTEHRDRLRAAIHLLEQLLEKSLEVE